MLKSIVLFVVMIDPEGYETMTRVSNITHKSYVECRAEKSQYRDVEGFIKFFCGDETRYFNKQQRLY